MSARAYRVAPRRRARGRPASRIHWDKLGRVVLVIVLFLILLSYVNPAVNFIDAWRDSHTQRSELLELRQEHSRGQLTFVGRGAVDREDDGHGVGRQPFGQASDGVIDGPVDPPERVSVVLSETGPAERVPRIQHVPEVLAR